MSELLGFMVSRCMSLFVHVLTRRLWQGRKLTTYYDIGKKLGKGSYAVVQLASLKRTGETFAVKIISKEKSKEKRLKSEVCRSQTGTRFTLLTDKLREKYSLRWESRVRPYSSLVS